ncbi:MAG: TIGR03790 family protein [Vicinamibacterales bacterium]
MRLLVVVTLLLCQPADGKAQGVDNLLVVVNGRSAESVQVGDYYVRKRRVPPANLLRIEAPADEQVPRQVYERDIEAPIAAWLARNGAHDRILYIVLTKGVPLRIDGVEGSATVTTVASVDSELALLYRRMWGRAATPQGRLPNPYFLGDRPVAEAPMFTHEAFDIFLVARLDGYTVPDVIALIDRGSDPAPNGRIALDEKASLLPEPGNRWLERTAERLKLMGQGDRVMLETTGQAISDQRDLLGYYSWGSNDPAIRMRDQNLRFANGALAAAYVSTDGRTLKEPPAAWTLGSWQDRATYFGGSPQSLSGDLIRQGVTGVAGHVAEPYLDATIRPDILFPAYIAGFNLVEAFYLAMPYVSWQTIVIGDPLAAPFRTTTLAAADIDRGWDRATELPAFFSARALEAIGGETRQPEAAGLVLRARARLAREDTKGAVEALERATTVDPRLVNAHLLLASLYERTNSIDSAIDYYRRVIATAPGNILALNNLAYALAEHQPVALPEALTLARRANTIAPRNGAILDTLAWILHLSGDERAASATIAQAIELTPTNSETLLHGAVIDAQAGNREVAARSLARALALTPALESRPDVRRLKQALSDLPARSPSAAPAATPGAVPATP